ncbi:MAG TPA: hypothetical protein VF271_10870 [Rhodanobacteraceae bacterium]
MSDPHDVPDRGRRHCLQAAALLPAAALALRALPAVARSTQGAANARFVLQPHRRGRTLGEHLANLSCETLQVVGGRYFSPDNKELVALYRQLDPNGILRIGGNTSDYTVWEPWRGRVPVQHKPDGSVQKPYVLRQADIDALAGFLKATGWRLIFGVNLKIGVPGMALALARAVREAVGDQLVAIQIGNEANDYPQRGTYADFIHAWLPYAKVLRAAGLPLGGPDTGANTDWVIAYARQFGAQNVLLSRHYYRGGEKHGSIRDLLSGARSFYGQVDEIVRVADAWNLPFYLSEANSYWGGGRDGVSSTFASTLWGADFTLALASRGVAGVAFHGGSLSAVGASLTAVGGGVGQRSRAVGDVDAASARRMAVSSYYSPIAGDAATGFEPRPLYHGLLLAQRFAGATTVPGRLSTGGSNLVAYAARRGKRWQVALINKDLQRDAQVQLDGLPARAHGTLARLVAPSIASAAGVRLQPAGALAVDANGRIEATVAHASAAYIELEAAT